MSRSADETKKLVRENYSRFIKQGSSCGCSKGSCCGGGPDTKAISMAVGYSENEIGAVPDGANLGFGCGNPTTIASLKEGETVLDLGSGAGLDAFLSAQKVGPSGRVIGVDMTRDMIEMARLNAQKGDFKNVEFRHGEIEALPLNDSSVDVVISNCVINLSPDKARVFKEAFRVLKPGGRIMVSDIVLIKELPDEVKNSPEAYAACVSGAVLKEAYLSLVRSAGFDDICIAKETPYDAGGSSGHIQSVSVSAVKKGK